MFLHGNVRKKKENTYCDQRNHTGIKWRPKTVNGNFYETANWFDVERERGEKIGV